MSSRLNNQLFFDCGMDEIIDVDKEFNNENIINSESDDLGVFYSYAKKEAENQRNFSLCRKYKVPVAVSGNRYRHLVSMLGQFRKDKECISIEEFKCYIKTKSEQPFTHSEIMLCLENMQTNGLVIIDKDNLYIVST